MKSDYTISQTDSFTTSSKKLVFILLSLKKYKKSTSFFELAVKESVGDIVKSLLNTHRTYSDHLEGVVVLMEHRPQHLP